MLKNCLLALLLGALVGLAPLSSLAQDQQPATSEAQEGHGHGHAHMDPAKHAAMLAKRLNLSSDQQSKVEDVLKSEQSQMESLRSDSSQSREDRHAKMMDIHKASNDQIRGLLNPDQQKQWDEMQSRREQRMEGHHGAGEAAPNSTPPQL